MKVQFIFMMFCTGLIVLTSLSNSQTKKTIDRLDQIAVDVNPEENREFSYTDKKSGYFYSTTHSEFNENWFSGWNVFTKRILKDYNLFIDGKKLLRMESKVKVYPYKLERVYNNTIESFFMFDNIPVLLIELSNTEGTIIGIRITGDLTLVDHPAKTGLLLTPKEDQYKRILIAPFKNKTCKIDGEILTTDKSAEGFLIIFEENEKNALKTCELFRKNYKTYLNSRMKRMEELISDNNKILSDNDSLDKALNWITLTTDQLIMKQMGWGIYAGLPWFNDYWGRDMFITLPGACLVNGQFQAAKNILLSFAKFQNNDPSSKYYGRVPNRARPDEIIYNSTDGTPRFIIEIMDYIRYSGDTSIIRELYPNIKRAVEGSIKYWVDKAGYLTHDDADTWMDAKEKGVRPFSPRGNRANDIQSLWYQQLVISAGFAEYMLDKENYYKWIDMSEKIKSSFVADFFDSKHDYMADRLTSESKKDFKLRPNQLYAYELINSEEKKNNITKIVWQSLVYPWGVASLSQADTDFYPYHENWHYYHKDAAYHNGTVWLWNNGMAMQRMLEAGQSDIAYQLFKNMNRQAFSLGAVGSLSENADALPREGKIWSKPSGTFLQAWSNAEHLRVWYQYFLGIRPEMERNLIIISPQIPSEIKSLQVPEKIGSGKILFSYTNDGSKIYEFKSTGFSPKIIINLPGFEKYETELIDGSRIKLIEKGDELEVFVFTALNYQARADKYTRDAQKASEIKKNNLFFKDVNFCKPVLKKNLKSLRFYYEKALTF